jgi:hypothetical protein
MPKSSRTKKSPHGSKVKPYDKIAHLIGSWDSGGKQLSTRSGEKFADMLKQDTDARRSNQRRSARRDHR